MEKHPLHLKIPDLQTSPEVEDAVAKQERLSGEKVPNDPAERIEAYMSRLENVFLNKDERVRERNIEMLRDKIYDAVLIKREDVPESHFELQQRIARERGQAVEHIPANVREQMKTVVIEDQKASLDAWIDYLSSDDAVYPAWFKYFVFRNVTKLSQFDKELGKFKERTKHTTAPFPDIYREPLAQIADIYEQVKADNKNLKEPEIQAAFSKKFPALYAELIQKSLAASMENREEIRGEWVKYEQGHEADAERLFRSLEGKGTGWCTAGHSTAEAQVESGDFYVYYTNDATGKPTQSRIAIRMEENRLAEVRGILQHQSLEPQMNDVLEAKLKEFGPEADKYKKKSADMKLLTLLERKTKENQPLTKDELVFLYEMSGTIEGFGYQKDPRVKELRDQRNPEADMPVVFDCTPNQIARTSADITEGTKAYVGKLGASVFDKIREFTIEHIYTRFPEGKIHRYTVPLGGKTVERFKSKLTPPKYYISDWANQLLESGDFMVLKGTETADLVRLSVADLGFPDGATTDQIYQKAEELGLELCPAEVGPQLRLSTDDPDYMLIAMKQITDRGGGPDVFYLYSGGGELGLSADGAEPDRRWGPGNRFVFLLRKEKL